MKRILPVLIALLGLAAGVGAGLALKPAPEPEVAATDCPPSAEGPDPGGAGGSADRDADAHPGAEAHAEPCAPAATDPFAPVRPREKKPSAELAYVAMDKPFVVPVFAGDKVSAMVVISLSVETDVAGAPTVQAVKPRLRDGFLKVMFRHANSGGFDGSFTTGRKMEDLKSALLKTAREVLTGTPVEEVLITEIARQDG